MLFPLQDIDKTEVRRIAAELGLTNASKKDSTGICFIGERNFRNFLQTYLPNQPGQIVDLDGKVVGEHAGQRRGLGLGGTADGQGRWFVVDKELSSNRLIVSHGDEEVLMSKALTSYAVNWIPNAPPECKFTCKAKFRYRQPEQGVDVEICDDGHVHVTFHEKQRAVTPGQFVVFYDEHKCLGGGVIDEVYK